MVTEVLDVTLNVNTIVQNAQIMKILVLRAIMAIIPALLETAHQSVYPVVKFARQEPRVHHARRDMITPLVEMIVLFVAVLKIVIVKMVNAHHVRTGITISEHRVIVYVQVTVSCVHRILIVACVRMVIIKVPSTTTITPL
jgi:hypothetical protein